MNRRSSILESSRREALFVMAVWLACCIYTVGYAALFAYRPEPVPRSVFGIPAWVFWGIMAPWTVCTLITCWYALWGIRDEDLGEEREDGAPPHGSPSLATGAGASDSTGSVHEEGRHV